MFVVGTSNNRAIAKFKSVFFAIVLTLSRWASMVLLTSDVNWPKRLIHEVLTGASVFRSRLPSRLPARSNQDGCFCSFLGVETILVSILQYW